MPQIKKVSIKLIEDSQYGTFSKLSTGTFECYILERPKDGDHPRIPAGTYKCLWTITHPLHPGCYEVMNVKDRTAILIHSANWFQQLLGCLAPGRAICDVEGTWEGKPIKQMGVTSSKDALDGLIENLGKLPFELTITR